MSSESLPDRQLIHWNYAIGLVFCALLPTHYLLSGVIPMFGDVFHYYLAPL